MPLFGDPESRRREHLEDLARRVEKLRCHSDVEADRAEFVREIRSRAGRPILDPPLTTSEMRDE